MNSLPSQINSRLFPMFSSRRFIVLSFVFYPKSVICFQFIFIWRVKLGPKFIFLPMDIQSSLVAQTVKSLPAMWETQVRSLGQKGPLERGMAIYSSILAWKIPWMEEPGRPQSMGSQRVGHEWATNILTSSCSSTTVTKALFIVNYFSTSVKK